MERKKCIVLMLVMALLFTSVPVHAETEGDGVQMEELVLTDENRYDPVYYQEPKELYPRPIARARQAIQASLSLEEYVLGELKDLSGTIDVSAYNIPREEAGTVFYQILNNHPELYYVGGGIGYSHSNGVVLHYTVSYLFGKEEIQKQQAEIEEEVDKAVAQIDFSSSDLEKALAVHDFLARHCEYDYENYLNKTVPDVSHNMYGSLVNRAAVCDGYADAFLYIMRDKLGIDCTVVSSNTMAHAWNMIEIGGNWYHVDVTWDDPTWDSIGRTRHAYFMLSDGAVSSSENGNRPHTGWVSDLTADSAIYDQEFWADISSSIIRYQGAWFYSKYDANGRRVHLVKRDSLLDGKESVVYTENGTWNNYIMSGMYLDMANGRLYFNTRSDIRRLDSDGTITTVYQPAVAAGNCIYGFTIRGNQVCYAIQDNPNLQSKQAVQTHTLAELEPIVVPEIKGVSAEDVQAVYDGTAKGITVKGTQAGDVVRYALEGVAGYRESQPEMVDAGTYQVLYHVERNGYKPFAGKASVAIAQATPAYTAPSGLKGSSGKTLGSVALPEGFVWQTAEGTKLSEEGTYVYQVKYVPEDTKNYKEVTDIQVQVTVSCPGHQYSEEVTKEPSTTETGIKTYTCGLCKDTYTEEIEKLPLPVITGIGAADVQAVYDGNAKTIAVTGLKNGDVVSYALEDGAYRRTQPEMKNAGTYQVSYRVERDGYQAFEGSARVVIEQAAPSYTVPGGLEGDSGKTLASVGLPDGFSWQTATDTKFSAEGTYTYLAKYVPADTQNYIEVSGIQVQVTVRCPGHQIRSEVTKEPSLEETGIRTCTCVLCGYAYTEVIDKLTAPAIIGIQAESLQAVYDGEPKAIRVTGAQAGDVVSYALADGAFSAVQPQMIEAGVYQVLYRVERHGYQAFEGSAVVMIEQAVPAYTVPEGLRGNIGDTLASVGLPKGFTWQSNENTILSGIGSAQYLVKYVPEDTKNYKEVSDILVEVTVSCPGHQYAFTVTKEPTAAEKGERQYTCGICGDTYTEEIERLDPSLPEIEGVHAENVVKTYDGASAQVALEGILEGDLVYFAVADGTYSSQQPEMKDAGEYQMPYRVERKGYKAFAGSVSVRIEQAVPAYDIPSGLKGSVGGNLGAVMLPEGYQWQSGMDARFNREGTFHYLVRYVPEDTRNYQVVSGISVQVAVTCPGHVYGSVIVREPTTVQKGFRTHTCRICGDTYTEEIAMLVPQKPGNVSGQKVSKATASSLKFTWKKGSGVRYELVLTQGKKKAGSKDVSGNTATFSKLKAGTEYSLKITPYRTVDGRKVYASKSATVKAATAPAKVKMSSVKKSGSKKAKVTWKKVSGASGYEVYMRTGSGKYKKVKTLASGKKVSYVQSGLKKGKTYGFRVRAYKKVGKMKAYGSYSSVKSIKMK